MLSLRFSRSGRRNSAFFRIVLTESSRPAKSGFIKVLGWYNPHTKETSLNKDEILEWLNKGAQPSNSLAKLLEGQKVKHKSIKFVPDHAKDKKGKKGEEKPKVEAKTESSDEKAETADDTTAEDKTEEKGTEEETKAEKDIETDKPDEKPADDIEKEPKA